VSAAIALLLVTVLGAQGPASAEGTWRADLPGSGALTLQLGGEGQADVFGLPGTWEQDGETVTVGSPDGVAAGELAGGRLLLVVGGMPLVFVRVGAAPTGKAAPTRRAPVWKAKRLLPGRQVSPKGAFAQTRVPRGFTHAQQGAVLLVSAKQADKPGQVRVLRRLMTPAEQEQPLEQLMATALAAETKGAPTETRLAPEDVRVGRYQGARAELKVHVLADTGAFTKIDLDVFVIRAGRFAYVFAGMWPEARRKAMRPVLETMVSTFKFRKPTENKTLKRQLLGCWDRYEGHTSAGDGFGSSSEGRYRFDGASGRYAYDGSSVVSGPGASAISETHEQGGFLVVGRELLLFPDEGQARVLSPKKKGGMLLIGGGRWLPCD
jgi:hypothetical protein